MEELKSTIEEYYGNRTRIRVNGLCFQNDQLLMVLHKGIGENGQLWIPPGGGVEFGESAEEALIREINEETGLKCVIDEFCFVFEYLKPPFHAIELFFKISITGGQVKTGTDPEMDLQIIDQVSFMDENKIYAIEAAELHNVFTICKSFEELLKLKGYVLFPK